MFKRNKTATVYQNKVIIYCFFFLKSKRFLATWSLVNTVLWITYMFWTELYPHPTKEKNYVEVQTLSNSCVTIFGDKFFAEVIKLKWGH